MRVYAHACLEAELSLVLGVVVVWRFSPAPVATLGIFQATTGRTRLNYVGPRNDFGSNRMPGVNR